MLGRGPEGISREILEEGGRYCGMAKRIPPPPIFKELVNSVNYRALWSVPWTNRGSDKGNRGHRRRPSPLSWSTCERLPLRWRARVGHPCLVLERAPRVPCEDSCKIPPPPSWNSVLAVSTSRGPTPARWRLQAVQSTDNKWDFDHHVGTENCH